MVGRYANYPLRAKVMQTTADLHLTWDVAYAPGTLRAVGAKNGQVMTTVEIDTTGDPAAIKLTADCNEIKTAWRDVAHITVEVVDEKGRLVPTAENEIAFELDGPGRILGVDNGRPDSHESFQGNHRKAFNGLALVMLQSTGKSGTFRLSASSPGLAANRIIVTSHAG
jgi:beta-galactosidase